MLVWGGGKGRNSPKKGCGVCGLQDPLFMPLLLLTRHPIQAQIWKKTVTFCFQNQSFQDNMANFRLHAEAPIWWQLFVKQLKNFAKISVFKALPEQKLKS